MDLDAPSSGGGSGSDDNGSTGGSSDDSSRSDSDSPDDVDRVDPGAPSGGSSAPPQDTTGGTNSPSEEVEDAAEDYDGSAPPQDSTGGAVSPSEEVENAAEDYNRGVSRNGGDSSGDPSAPPQDSTGGAVSPSDEVEDAADVYGSDTPSGRNRPDAGDTTPGVGGGTGAPHSVKPDTPDRVRVDDSVESRPVSSREDAADQFDRRLQNYDVDEDQVRQSDNGWVLTESAEQEIERRQAAARLDEQYPTVGVGLGDVRETDDGWVVREGLRSRAAEERAANRFDDEYPEADVSRMDVESTSDGMVRLDERTQREIATQRIIDESDQVGPDSRFGEGDLEFDFEGGELVDVSLTSEAQTQPAETVSQDTADQDGEFTVVEAGGDWPTNRGEAVSVGADLLTGDGAELIKTDAPTNQREVSEAIISARRERLGIDIDPIDPGDAADSAVDRTTNIGRDEGALVAAGIGFLAPEPSTTTAGAAILVSAAGAAVASQRSELDVGQPNQEVSEVEAGEQTVNEMEVTDPDVTELDVGEFATGTTEMQVGDPTRANSEVDVPMVEASGILEEGSEPSNEEDLDDLLDQFERAERSRRVQRRVEERELERNRENARQQEPAEDLGLDEENRFEPDEGLNIDDSDRYDPDRSVVTERGDFDTDRSGPTQSQREAFASRFRGDRSTVETGETSEQQVGEDVVQNWRQLAEPEPQQVRNRDSIVFPGSESSAAVGVSVLDQIGQSQERQVSQGVELSARQSQGPQSDVGVALGTNSQETHQSTISGANANTPIEREIPEAEVTVDTSFGNNPMTGPMTQMFSPSPAQTFESPPAQTFSPNQSLGNGYPNTTNTPSRPGRARPPSRPPFPGFESDPVQPEPAEGSSVDIQITNPVATATDVLGVGTGMEMTDTPSSPTPAEDDFEDEWPSGAGSGGFDGWGGGDFDGGGFDDAGFDGFDGGDMWDPDNWETDQGGQGDPFGGF